MSFCRKLLAPSLIALAVGLAHPQTARADTLPPTNPIKLKLQVSPPCVQPGGLVHVLIQPDSPPALFSFFDIFPEIAVASQGSFFDFYGDDARIHSFFDVFCELALQPGQTSPTTRKLSLVCGTVARKSISIIFQMDMATAGGGGGAGDGTIVLQRNGVRLATYPVMLYGPTSPRGHVLGSCQAISSFFDIFPEIAIDEPGVHLTPRQRMLLHHEVTHVLQAAGRAELDALGQMYPHDRRLRQGVELLRIVVADLDGDTLPD